ncbi:MAG: N-acetyltransferase family protein [Psychrobium sp.]|nr:N-acetyltransferase family protein [Psychrobium sp.]
MITIKAATIADLTVINDIYNHFISHTTVTFNVTQWTTEERAQWYQQDIIDTPYHLLVATYDGQVVGFAYNGAYNKKAAYATSTELTVYKALSCQVKGVGAALYQHLLEIIEQEGYHRAYALITLPNLASIALHQKFNFTQIGVLTEVGKKFDQFHDVAILEKCLYTRHP